MGVQGLWKLVEPSGRIVPLETMANKILAVDVSIWLHQAMKGMHDAQGAPVAIAHLLVLFHRLCKLLFYKIRPVFVFDGGVPALKRQTMANRRVKKSAASSEASRVRGKLLKNLLKHEALRQVLNDQAATEVLGLSSIHLPGPSEEEELYKLPEVATQTSPSTSDSNESSSDDDDKPHMDIHSVDVNSEAFKALPPQVRHDILSELKETRKQNSWGTIDKMPSASQDFSDFQMGRLLKRRAVQRSLDEVGKEIGAHEVSLEELQGLLGDNFTGGSVQTGRLPQEDSTRYLLIQKPATSITPEVDDKTLVQKSEGFDITEHLNDVEWSSDSDSLNLKECMTDSEECTADGEIAAKIEVENMADSIQIKEEINEGMSEVEDVKTVSSTRVSNTKVNPSAYALKIKNIVKAVNETDDILRILEDGVRQQKYMNDANEVKEIKVEPENSGSSLKSTDSSPEKMETFENKAARDEPPQELTDVEQKTVEKIENVLACESNEHLPQKSDLVVGKKAETIEEENFENNSKEHANEVGDISKIPEQPTVPESLPINEINTSEKVNLEEIKNVCGAVESLSTDSEDDLVEVEEFEQSTQFSNHDEGEDAAQEEESSTQVQKDFKELDDMLKVPLTTLPEVLSKERNELMLEKGRQARMALGVTDQMYSDAQELLRLFGVPFIIAPMEAEAQCATLDLLGLTEGTITDDSDIWLFGGRTVYKNFFNQKKHVLEYRCEDIKQYFKLSREDMIKLALLVGSDYTPGLTGIGPVTALEVLAAFPSPTGNDRLLAGLIRFRDWVSSGFVVGPTRVTLKNKLKNAALSEGFPSQAVVDAYLKPEVDDSEERFSWAKPDLLLLQNYTRQRFGWSKEKCNELLLPVMKKLLEATEQTTIDKFFRVVPKPDILAGRLSKRVEGAIKRLGKEPDLDDPEPSTSRPKKQKIGEISTEGMDPIKYRLHQDDWIPQKDLEAKRKAELRMKAAKALKAQPGRGRGRNMRYNKTQQNSKKLEGPKLSDSSSEGD